MNTLYIGLDVHKATITIATAEEGRDGELRSQGMIENTPASVDKLMKRLAKQGYTLHFCYEAGCCGYGLHRQITAAGHLCSVIAPSRIPKKPGERVKTDRRDALNLARLLRAGELDVIWVPDVAHEAMRDLVRSRADACDHLKAAKQQLQSFLLRHGRIYDGLSSWTRTHYRWLTEQKFEHSAHQIVFQDYINAIHDGEKRENQLIKQIEKLLPHWAMKPLVDAPAKLSSYFGLVPSEHSSGKNTKREGITKAGNGEARRVLIQAAWCYRFPARITKQKEMKLTAAEKAVRDVAWKAQVRLCARYRRFIAGGKMAPIACAAIARELVTFIWEMGQIVPLTS